MAVDPFDERLAQIRLRFASRLEGKIAAVEDAAAQFSSRGASLIESLETAHRTIHELCGVAPTLGFVAIGRAARSVEQVLLQPLRAQRELTAEEAADLRSGLDELRATAGAELLEPKWRAGE
jgi:HPt (histidine-containing phosphotransfer) domain-containing protein